MHRNPRRRENSGLNSEMTFRVSNVMAYLVEFNWLLACFRTADYEAQAVKRGHPDPHRSFRLDDEPIQQYSSRCMSARGINLSPRRSSASPIGRDKTDKLPTDAMATRGKSPGMSVPANENPPTGAEGAARRDIIGKGTSLFHSGEVSSRSDALFQDEC